MTESISQILDKIVGMACWYASASGAVGSMFLLHLGDKVPRERPLKREGILQRFQGEGRIFVQDALWELYDKDLLIAFDESDSSVDGELVKALNRLVGAKLENYLCTEESLELEFQGSLLLKIGRRKSDDRANLAPRFCLNYRDERVNIQ